MALIISCAGIGKIMSEYEAAMQPGEADRKEDAAMAENPEASGTMPI